MQTKFIANSVLIKLWHDIIILPSCRHILVTFLTLFSGHCFSQAAVKSYVTTNVSEVSSIDPAHPDDSDLSAIGNAIGEARIVMLGEQDHGDAPTFLAKTRLIKYLHEKKGFNVLAFESDFFSINYNWQLVREGKLTLNDIITRNISGLWTQCTACYPLFKEYLPFTLQTQNPLKIAVQPCLGKN